MKPTADHLHTVCKMGKGEQCCRFLVGDGSGIHCVKLVHHLAAAIDHAVANGRMRAQGDNCDGLDMEIAL